MPFIEGIRKLQQREHLFCCHRCVFSSYFTYHLPTIRSDRSAATNDGIMYVDLYIVVL